jgi:hypothetical protein
MQVKSDEEAVNVLAKFMTSDSWASRRLISILRKDGMKDEYLTTMQTGCRDCYVRPGNRARHHDDDEGAWYVVASIAPREEKKTIVLEIPCDDTVWLYVRLYGG